LAFVVTIPTSLFEVCVTVFKKCHLACQWNLNQWFFSKGTELSNEPHYDIFSPKSKLVFHENCSTMNHYKKNSIDWAQLSSSVQIFLAVTIH